MLIRIQRIFSFSPGWPGIQRDDPWAWHPTKHCRRDRVSQLQEVGVFPVCCRHAAVASLRWMTRPRTGRPASALEIHEVSPQLWSYNNKSPGITESVPERSREATSPQIPPEKSSPLKTSITFVSTFDQVFSGAGGSFPVKLFCWILLLSPSGP